MIETLMVLDFIIVNTFHDANLRNSHLIEIK